MRFVVLFTILTLGLAAPATAQDPAALDPTGAPSPEDPNVAELEALMAKIQARVEAIDAAAAERNEALEFLARQVEQASRNLTSQDEQNENLQQKNADLDLKLENLVESRSELDLELARLASERDTLVSELQTQVAGLTGELQGALDEKEALSRALEDARLAAAGGEATAAAQTEEIAGLNRQIASLREEVAKLNGNLDSSKTRNVDLDRRLKIALANKVEDLARYRSEFFGRLGQVLGDHPDIRVVGDRFVFQSEILFESGSAELGYEGQAQMGRLARTLIDISRDIPREIDWVLRVDGHTDSRPIRTLFPSNWELSTARAISVVKYLIDRGLPPQRLAATGFGQFQPIDPGRDEIAYRRNRRIELKLTQR